MKVIERIDGFRTMIGGPPPSPELLAPGEEPMLLHEVLLDLKIAVDAGEYFVFIDARDGTFSSGTRHESLAAAHEQIEFLLDLPATAWRQVDEPMESADESAPQERSARRRSPPRSRGRRRA